MVVFTGFLYRMSDVLIKYRILTIVACILSIFTCVNLILGLTYLDYFAMIPIPMMFISIFGSLVFALFSEKETKRLIFAGITIWLCVIALFYFPFIDRLPNLPIIRFFK